MRTMRPVFGFLAAMGSSAILAAPAASLPAYDHIVVVVEENESDVDIIGNPDAPYINSLATQGASFTDSHALTHPSQPNYLNLFSGSNQGVVDNTRPADLLATPNLGGNLLAKGFTFTGYAGSLPSVGFTGDAYSSVPDQNQYVRRHNPWVNWQDSSANGIPAASNRPFTDFPTDFSTLPTVAFVVPDLQEDMHDGSIAEGDAWFMSNLGAYAEWAKLHNSLLIITWDEDHFTGVNRIATVFFGADVITGQYDETINHFNVLRTIEDVYGLDHAGSSADVSPITDAFATAVPEPGTWKLLGVALVGFLLRRGWQRSRNRA